MDGSLLYSISSWPSQVIHKINHLTCWIESDEGHLKNGMGLSNSRVIPGSDGYSEKMLDSGISFSSVAQMCPILCDPMDCNMPGLPVHHQLLEFTQAHVHWASPHPLSSPSSAFNLSQHQGLFQWVILHIRWPKCWSFSFSISPSNEYSGLISFRMDWLDLLAVQETLKNLLQHYSSKASILWHSAFFMVQLSHPYMTTGKTTALTRQTFVGKVTSLLFNMLSRLVITFFPRSKYILI